MKIVKYLFFCFWDSLALNVDFTKDAIVGSIQIFAFMAIYFITASLSTWYYGILITLGCILALYAFISIIEITVRLIIKLFKRTSK